MKRAAVIALSAIVAALPLAAGRVYVDDAGLDGSGLCLQTIPTAVPLDFFAVEGHCALPDNKPRRHRKSEWSVVWNYTAEGYSYASLSFDYRNAADDLYGAVAEVEIGRCRGGERRVEDRAVFDSGFDFGTGCNSMAVEWSAGVARVYAGNRGMRLCASMNEPSVSDGRCGLMSDDRLVIDDMVVDARLSKPALAAAAAINMSELAVRLADEEEAGAESDALVGLWTYLDRVNDPSKARMGGRYTLAVVADGDGAYAIYYVGGAEVGASVWRPGMLKGRLSVTAFRNHYGLVWYDAMFEPVTRDIFADVDESGSILSLSFPLMETVVRFSRSDGMLPPP